VASLQYDRDARLSDAKIDGNAPAKPSPRASKPYPAPAPPATAPKERAASKPTSEDQIHPPPTANAYGALCAKRTLAAARTLLQPTPPTHKPKLSS